MYGIYESGRIIARFVAPMTVRSNQPVFASDTLSLKRDTYRRPAQRWEIETRLEPLSLGGEDLLVNLVEKGHSEATLVLVPQNYGAKARIGASGSPTATGAIGASLITVGNNFGLLPKGTFIRFSNHSKIYMTVTERSGNGTLQIYPALRSGISGTVFTCRDDVIMPCYYDLDSILGMSYSDGLLMDMGTVKLVEAI
jgi:hypothetical protein